MDLDGYEADLADFSLQEQPFYESSPPNSVYDFSMLRTHYNQHQHTHSLSQLTQQKSIIMKSTDGKKKRKCVSFLPNYVQVRHIFFSIFIYYYIRNPMKFLPPARK